jgi:molybdate/tungstate transport system ATP-binding protein
VISLEWLTVRSGGFQLKQVSFDIPEGGYGMLMGKTGSGKTTILEAIAGLRDIDEGTIRLAGADVTHLAPGDRNIGYVPQDRALFQTMTVRENLAFAPSIRGWTREETKARVEELARLLEIVPLLDRPPAGLSGGEAQRVALGRALAARPKILLLDEPLSALDDETWEGMIELLGEVRRATGVTTLHVTHRREESRRLADRVLILADGAVRAAAPADLQEQAK